MGQLPRSLRICSSSLLPCLSAFPSRWAPLLPIRRAHSSAVKMPKFNVGLSGSATVMVSSENTARTMGSGSLDVFATPAMVALLEKAACAALAGSLEDGETTGIIHVKTTRRSLAQSDLQWLAEFWHARGGLGTGISVTHLSPTPLGLEVSAEAVVTEGGDKSCTFQVKAVDNSGTLVGEGKHSRVLVNAERFMAKANAKTAKT